MGDKDRKGRPQSRANKTPATDRDMGSALRSIYQRAVEEKIPDEMLDLLGKLG